MAKVIQTEDGSEFTVDSEILISQSKYFKALFQYDHRPCILVKDINGNVMKQILHFLQTKNMELSENDMFGILKAADYLMLDEIVSSVCRAVPKEINLENCIDFFLAASNLNHTGVSELCYSYIQTHFELVAERADIGRVSFECLRRWLTDENTRVDSEEAIWKAIVTWLEADEQERIQRIPPLLTAIRFDSCKEDLVGLIMGHPLVMKNQELRNVIAQNGWIHCRENLVQAVKSCCSAESANPGHRIQRFICAVKCSNIVNNWKHSVTFNMMSLEGKRVARFSITGRGTPKWTFDCHPQKVFLFFDLVKEYFCIELLKGTLAPFVRPPHWDSAETIAECCLHSRIYSISIVGKTGALKTAFYVPEQDRWNVGGSILPPDAPIYAPLEVAAHDGLIYAVVAEDHPGKKFGGVYDPNADAWREFALPEVMTEYFAVVSFNGSLLMIRSGNTEVLRFHTDEGIWRHFQHLPSAYGFPRAVVRNRTLLVYQKYVDGNERNRRPIYREPDSLDWQDGNELFKGPDCHALEDPEVVRKYHRQLMDAEWKSLSGKWTRNHQSRKRKRP